MSFVPTSIEYNGPYEAAHVDIDDDRYDLAECGAAGWPKAHIGPLTSATRF